MDLDDNLSLEETFYWEGYREGEAENVRHNYIEGKQYGLQVGFQRFALHGQILGLCDVFQSVGMQNASLLKHIESIRSMIDGLAMDNDQVNVSKYENTLVKIKNKFRTLLLAFQRQVKRDRAFVLLFDQVEELSTVIAGEIKGYVEDEGANTEFLAQDQAQAW